MDAERFAALCRALGDPTRVRLLECLLACGEDCALDPEGRFSAAEGPTAGELCCRTSGSPKVTSTLSFHLKELRLAGLIRMERSGRHMICSPDRSLLAAFVARVRQLAPPQTVNTPELPPDPETTRDIVRRKYGEAALRVLERQESSCCGGATSCCSSAAPASDPITGDLYSAGEAAALPEAALLASLGCGNPTALATLAPGETVLDLGSGGGVDVLLAAGKVGSAGFVYGLDMTEEMLELAERNRAEAGVTNARFLKGHIEAIPLPDASVDVIVSNCVINLSADKDAVLREAFRVLRPGGRFAVSDVVVEGEIPDAVRRDMELYVGCVAGALERSEYVRRLEAAGFREAEVQPTRRYAFSELEGAWAPEGVGGLSDEERRSLDGRIMGAFIRATKPV